MTFASFCGVAGALRLCAGREGWDVNAGLGQRAVKLLTPMGDITGGAVAIDHMEGRFSDVGELMKNTRRDVNHLPRDQGLAFFSKAHFRRSFDNEIHLLLLLVVPRNLPSFGIKRDTAHGKVFCLDGRGSARKVLRFTARGKAASLDF